MRKPRTWSLSGCRGAATALLLIVLASGCGTTRTSDTKRTATEQLLISHSIDDTVSHLDFSMLAGKRVYLDPQYLDGVTDKGYLVSTLRQHLLACGCRLQEDIKKATYVVEPRSGGVGTDSTDMLIGVPKMSIPSVMPGIPGAMIPEVALAKKSNRRAVAKIAVFAYNRISGDPVWQSGTVEAVSRQRNSWVCGAGPFQHGHLNQGVEFDEHPIPMPLLKRRDEKTKLAVTEAAVWKSRPLPDADEAVAQTGLPKPESAAAAKPKVVRGEDPSSPAQTAENAPKREKDQKEGAAHERNVSRDGRSGVHRLAPGRVVGQTAAASTGAR